MLCEYCGRNPAVLRVKIVADGEPAEYSLCAECARKLGYGNLMIALGAGVDGILDKIFPAEGEGAGALHCRCCGASFADIVRSGKVGCAECYRTFSEQLTPLIRRIHGSVSHRGKTAGGNLPQVVPKGQLSVMHRRLREAIESENFEQAAAIRDRIRRMEEEDR